MINVGPASRLGNCPATQKSFNVAIFSKTINVINVKLCMMVLFIELYLLIQLSVTLSVFQGHSKLI